MWIPANSAWLLSLKTGIANDPLPLCAVCRQKARKFGGRHAKLLDRIVCKMFLNFSACEHLADQPVQPLRDFGRGPARREQPKPCCHLIPRQSRFGGTWNLRQESNRSEEHTSELQ